MDRICAIKGIQDHIKDNIIHIGENSARELKPGRVLLPVGGLDGDSTMLPNKKATNAWAKRIQSEANKYFKSQYFGNIVEIDNVSDDKGTIVNILVNSRLVDHYVNKEGIMSNIEQISKNRFRNGLEQISKGKTESTSKEVLQKLISLNKNSALAKKLLELSENQDIKIIFDDVEKYRLKGNNFDSVAYFDPDKNEIHIASKMNVDTRSAYLTVLHEIMHNLSYKELRKNNHVTREFKRLYQYALNNMDNSEYGLHDMDEFLVALFTNPDFCNKLIQLPPMSGTVKFKNLFEEILNAILKFFDIKQNDTFYEQAMSVASHILTYQKERIDSYINVPTNELLSNKAPNFHIKHLEEKLAKLKIGDKSYSVRPTIQSEGVYQVNEDYYRVKLLNQEPKVGKDFSNINIIKAKHIAEEGIKYQHIQDFYNDKLGMFVYEITKIPAKEGKESEVKNKIKQSNEVRPELKQEVYFKRLLEKINANIESNTQNLKQAYDEKVANEQLLLVDKRTKLIAQLDEYNDTHNKQILVNMANDILDEVEKYILETEKQLNEGTWTINADELIDNIKILYVFEDLTGVRDRVGQLHERIKPTPPKDPDEKRKPSILTLYVLNTVRKMTGDKTLSFDDLNYDNEDISTYDRNFNTLGDVKNLIGRTIGYLINNAHANIERANRESYNSLKAYVDKLNDWATRTGTNKDNIYDVFMQVQPVKNINGDIVETYVLTRKYTPEFYNLEFKARQMNKTERFQYLSKFATFDNEAKRWKPISKSYYNKNYTKIQETPELKAFYDFFRSTIKDISKVLPIKNSDDFIPNIAEQMLIDAIKSGNTLGGKFNEALKHITGIYDASSKNNEFIYDENLMTDDIPLKYVKALSTDLKSKRLDYVLLAFMQFANEYEHMSDILPKARVLEEEIKSRRYIKFARHKSFIEGSESNISKMVKDVIDMQIKGKMKKDESYAPYVDFGLKYTSLLRIGLNPFNAMTNVFVGTISNIVEGVGGRYFTVKEFVKATKTFSTQAYDKDSKVNKLTDIFNPLMEMDDYENLRNIDINSKQYKEKIKAIMYWPQRAGEKLMQTSTMIAHLMHSQVTTKDGKTINMWEAFDETGKWKSEVMGYELTNDVIDKTTRKIHRINYMIHGRYSAKNAATLQQYALFRAAFQFKKWMTAAAESRLQTSRYDYVLEKQIEGRYRTLWEMSGKKLFTNPVEAIYSLVGPLFNAKAMLESGKYSELEIYNMRKNMSELMIILASVSMYTALGTDDEERKKNGFYKFAMNQLDRISGDMLFWYNVDELNRSVPAIPLTKTVNDMLKLMYYMPYAFGVENTLWFKDAEYQKGIRKGEQKTLAAARDIIPGVKPMTDVWRLTKDVPYERPK